MSRLLAALALAASTVAAAGPPPKVGHVFIIVLENQSFRVSFGPAAKSAYLARELPAQGALLREYYGTAHASLPNYVAMVSGQAPNPDTANNCRTFAEFAASGETADGQWIGRGCIYPKEVPTLAGQLEARKLTWKNYGEDSARGEPRVCRRPEIGGPDTARGKSAGDQYATRHVPWVYFHSIIDDAAYCGARVVDLADLDRDLAKAATTPNLSFIVPDVCSDGHDETCADGASPGGFGGIEAFLRAWVPKITASPAFRMDGLLVVIFDEADPLDPVEGSLACCGERPGPNVKQAGGEGFPGGPGGGRTGAIVLSRLVKPGTVSDVPYNHYSLLRSLEDIFGLPYLGYAGAPGLKAFGDDVYTGSNGGTQKGR